LRFDFRGVNTWTNGLTALPLYFRTVPPLGSTITLKMQYSKGDIVKTFTNEYTVGGQQVWISYGTLLSSNTGNTQIIKSDGTITAASLQKLSDFLSTNTCSGADVCSLSLALSGTTEPIDFQLLATGATIPDLNAVIIGDGLSDNGLYFQRVVDLIPTQQDI
jgi:hypothetical protein